MRLRSLPSICETTCSLSEMWKWGHSFYFFKFSRKTPTFHAKLLIYCMTQTCKNGLSLTLNEIPNLLVILFLNWARMEHPTLTTV